ncbi:MAG: hypothetical protein QXT77_04155 [Candidatus Methanomethylicaceae archaeon]
MTQEQRRLFAEKLMDTANIAVGALVFGQILSRGRRSNYGVPWPIHLAWGSCGGGTHLDAAHDHRGLAGITAPVISRSPRTPSPCWGYAAGAGRVCSGPLP